MLTMNLSAYIIDETLHHQFTADYPFTIFPTFVCVCVCMCVHACVCVHVCACMCVCECVLHWIEKQSSRGLALEYLESSGTNFFTINVLVMRGAIDTC